MAPVAPQLAKGGTKGRSSSGLTFDTAGLVQVAALARDAPLATDYSASALITQGRRVVPDPRGRHQGVRPAGAVADTLTMWARAVAGSGVGSEFGPHGTVFQQPL